MCIVYVTEYSIQRVIQKHKTNLALQGSYEGKNTISFSYYKGIMQYYKIWDDLLKIRKNSNDSKFLKRQKPYSKLFMIY
jgi:hypothetical protein